MYDQRGFAPLCFELIINLAPLRSMASLTGFLEQLRAARGDTSYHRAFIEAYSQMCIGKDGDQVTQFSCFQNFWHVITSKVLGK
jgi:hypothetical protein